MFSPDVLMLVGPRTYEKIIEPIDEDPDTEYPSWSLLFFTAPESEPELIVKAVFVEKDGRPHSCTVGPAYPVFDEMVKVVQEKEHDYDNPDIYCKMSMLIDHAVDELHDRQLWSGKTYLWSAL